MTDQEKRNTLKQATQDFVKGIINDTTNDIINVFEETKIKTDNNATSSDGNQKPTLDKDPTVNTR